MSEMSPLKQALSLNYSWKLSERILASATGRVDGCVVMALLKALKVDDPGLSGGVYRMTYGLRAAIVPARSASTGACR
jgi:hypothetical protein